jgi:glycosyltransferase involved in cell wall biosynthesis
MRIVFGHHLTLRYLGGGERWLIGVANELVKRGHDVEIYAVPLKVSGGIPIDNLKELLNGIPYKEAYHHNIEADVCYVTYHPFSGFNFSTKGKVIKGIHATTCWEPIDLSYGFLPVLVQLLHKTIGKSEIKRSDAIHTVAPYLKIDHPHVYKIPNYVDSKRFNPYPKPDKFTITYASRKSYQKGWDIFQELQNEYKNDDSIVFKVSGNIPEVDMPKFIAESHIGIVPSRYDSFGLSIIEFLLTNTPVITTSLLSHKALDQMLFFADDIYTMKTYINIIKSKWDRDKYVYEQFANQFRERALMYDKKTIMDRLENMFIEVYNK